MKKSKKSVHFVGMMGYADDVIILAPSVLNMNMMLSVTSKFCDEFDVKLNPEKTQLLTFDNHNAHSKIRFNGRVLQNVDCESHLGNYIGVNANDTMVENSIRKLIGDFNYLISIFKDSGYEIKYKLFKTF